ncbi:MAG: HesA/MoeB/ThiF family protein [Methanoregulaceae archaeon]|nr:HesA/MoeB/ThiF family protein [Methanoregulaceae archaeon]
MLSGRERERYSRQILLFGEEGQEQLREATIFIAGAGGLGSPVSMYLALLGVGTLIIADNDRVELTNLNRQILYREQDIGRRKAAVAKEQLQELNPDITVQALDATIDAASVFSMTENADGIVDALDDYQIRYLLNRVALENQIPLFHGGISGFFGQATTILPGKTPCLKCIVPHPPPREVFPVVGVTAGFIGMIQATEVCKYLLCRGDLLAGRLLLWDGMQGRIEEIPVENDPFCEACAGNATRNW